MSLSAMIDPTAFTDFMSKAYEKGEIVEIISGPYKGKKGEVFSVSPGALIVTVMNEQNLFQIEEVKKARH